MTADMLSGRESEPDRPEGERPDDRLRIVLGDEGLARLRTSTVMVLGLGGVGSNCVVALARGGVGRLVLVDRDRVSPSNINRQAVARHSTVGRVKVDVMREMVADLNPACEVTCLHAFLEKDRVAEQLDCLPRPDFIIDAIDTVAQKLRVALWAQERGYRLVSAMGAANKLDPTRFRFADVSETCVDPLARVMRKECRKRGIGPLEVLFSDEVPMDVGGSGRGATRGVDGYAARGRSLGTMSYMPAAMGLMIAGRVICELSGARNPNDVLGNWR